MKNLLTLLLSTLLLISCESKVENFYKTKSGEYASKEGKFIVKFPKKPNHRVVENKIGLDVYQVNHYQCAIGEHRVFTFEYTDLPKHVSDSWDTQEYYEQSVKTLLEKYAGLFKISEKKPREQHGLKGIEFVFVLNPNSPEAKGSKGNEYIEGRIYKVGNRVYSIMFLGEANEKTESYMESFRLMKSTSL